ncbi:MAG: hypothetical protein V2I43_14505, partial [Parvularcula sp.]|nr:hypothetical protein [Parvularcula sp.]
MKARRIASATGASPAKTPTGLGFLGLILSRGTADLTARTMLRGIFLGVMVTTVALEGVRFGYVERPIPLSVAFQDNDPVVASVGHELIRMSDAYAQASLIGEEIRSADDLGALIATGTIDAAADQAALAQAARQVGIDEALEIRAALALAERQILAEAYLGRIADAAVTEEAIVARYEQETSALRQDSMLRISEIMLPTRAEADAVHEKLGSSTFAAL